ncbi:hypothetical protein VTK26DRAFT_5813 [Humicola hyalothermophila]
MPCGQQPPRFQQSGFGLFLRTYWEMLIRLPGCLRRGIPSRDISSLDITNSASEEPPRQSLLGRCKRRYDSAQRNQLTVSRRFIDIPGSTLVQGLAAAGICSANAKRTPAGPSLVGGLLNR